MDAHLIARLYPYAEEGSLGHALRTIRMQENASLRIEPRMQDYSRPSSQSEDASADQDGEDDYGDDAAADDGYGYSPGIELRFDVWRKNAAGFVFGTSRNCDIVLPQRESLTGLARRQCVLAFDDQDRLVLRDLQARRTSHRGGTAVEYDGRDGGKRRGFTWILSGHPFARETHRIVIALHDRLRFLLVVEHHDLGSPQYQRNVAQFPTRVLHDPNAISLGSLGFNRESTGSTVTPSGAQSPSTETILLSYRELGRGGQAVVKRVWDVSTAFEYASKEPLHDRYHNRLRDEVEILKRERHDYIVQCFPELSRTSPPKLVMECLSLGSLCDQHQQASISLDETLTILQQGTSVLNYLHDRARPIAHRDIKPGNILVYSRSPLHIKLSDFGFSKASDDYLKTHCGTLLYMAPEVFKGRSYDTSVDIWSLGMVVYQYAQGLPSYDPQSFDGSRWTKNIMQTIADQASTLHCPLLSFLSRAMLVKDRKDRDPAHRCFQAAQHLSVANFRCGTSTPPAAPPTSPPTIPPAPPGHPHPPVLYAHGVQVSPWAASPSPGRLAPPTASPQAIHPRRARSPAPGPVSPHAVTRRRVAPPPRRTRRDSTSSGGGGAGGVAAYTMYGQVADPYYGATPQGREDTLPGYNWPQGPAAAAAAPRDLQPVMAPTAGYGPAVGGSAEGFDEWYPGPGGAWEAPAQQQHAEVRYMVDYGYGHGWEDGDDGGEGERGGRVGGPAYGYYEETTWGET
ncbi:CAMK family protein kinase [Staphylotrichum tortipilum]|uniref:non-specific serine/threonine protein kinase n=1 Tax=Staphylotrichum tortipilum TaxID=2831512 RepID=A0AAN6MJL8_9PEZI|nr:CAMK family protein kinase [Staphylotrichum longicolle]